jgi:hypothetical protein
LGGTVCNAPGGNELAALVGRSARWQIRRTTEAKATHDPARAAEAWFADARRRMAADDAVRLRAGCVPRSVLRVSDRQVGAVADIVRWDEPAGGAD